MRFKEGSEIISSYSMNGGREDFVNNSWNLFESIAAVILSKRQRPMIQIEESWKALVSELSKSSGINLIYVIGASDRGKTTFCRYLAEALSAYGPAAYVDCDPGQSVIGLPTTIGLQRVPLTAQDKDYPILYFTGALSPQGHLLQNLSGIKKISEKAVELDFKFIILDSSGFVLGDVPKEFQFHVIDLIKPGYLIAFQYNNELRDLLKNFESLQRIKVFKMPASTAVKPRDPIRRYIYRTEKFKAYFSEARHCEVEMSETGQHGRVPDFARSNSLENILVGLADSDNFTLSIGMIKSYQQERRILSIFSPVFDPTAVKSIHFGSLYVDPDDFKIRVRPYER